ncbi:MAG: outer rane immunogenic protein [Alphaproteobacteria bacterium]|jgi:opacity protein-like surface antigen|nr:outer rane immunogenic protein [Alphaproteobacteria bacterium]
MRLLILCAVAAVFGSQALAGSIDGSVLRGSADVYNGEPVAPPPRFLPGSPLYQRWQGVYFGGHVGLTNAGIDFGNGTKSLIDYILRDDVVGTHVAGWTTLGKADPSQATYGAFAGYNSQWDGNLIIGAELNYNRVVSKGLGSSASDSMTRLFNDDAQAPAQHHYFYTATVSSNASARIVDFATMRARAGVVIDRFLPYAFVGAAVGRVDVVRTATVSYTRHDIPDNVVPPATPITPEPDYHFGPQTRGENRKGVFAYGYTGGLGIDVALLPNVFVRAEWEYVQFFPVQDFRIHLNTGRVGVGIKF